MWNGWTQDLRDAARSLRRSPARAAAVVLTLGLGIGANAAVFSVVEAVLLRSLPYREPDRLALLWEKNPERGWDVNQVAPANYLDWQERARSVEAMAGFSDWFEQEAITAPGEPTPVRAMYVAGDPFAVLGTPPALGRSFRPQETWSDAPPAVVISDRLWRSRFAADPGIVGRPIELDRGASTVVGVMPPGFTFFSSDVDVWRTFRWDREARGQVWFRRAHIFRVVARLADGATLDGARRELEAVAADLERSYPETNTRMGAGASPLAAWLTGGVEKPLVVLFLAVGLVLLVACVNVAHLQLARALEQRRDNAVRGCLGASGGRLARRGLVDSLVLSLLGAGLGLAVARLALPLLVRLGGGSLPRSVEISVGRPVVLLAIALAAITALVCGLAPALQARRLDLERELRQGGRGGEGRRTALARQLLVGTELALAVVLASGAALLVRSMGALRAVDPGFDARGVLSATVSLPRLAYADEAAVSGFADRFLTRVRALPGVDAAGLASRLPLTAPGWSSDFSVEGGRGDFGIDVVHREVSPGYFEAMRVPLVAGRRFTAGDGAAAPPVVVINRALAERYFAGRDPLGQRICFDRVPDADSLWRTVVGVVGDERQTALGQPVRPEILAPLDQDLTRALSMVVHTAQPPEALARSLSTALAEIDPRLPLMDVAPMRAIVERSLARETFLLTLFATFAGLAVLLAAVGVYGVTAQSAARRRREVGLRMALGALPASVAREMAARFLGAAAAGAAIGAIAAALGGRAMEGLLYGVRPFDPPSLLVAPALLLAIALIASWLPAYRAARVEPARVLRDE